MVKRIMKYKYLLLLVFTFIFASANITFAEPSNIKLLVDGEDITELSSPIIENDRMLIPIRFVSESLGAIVEWDGENRRVTIARNDDHLKLKIDSRLIQYNQGKKYQLSDVAPKIINDRTYVPIRLVSNALGVGINWDGENRVVKVQSDLNSTVEPFYAVEITNLEEGSYINGKTEIQYELPETLKSDNYKVKMLLLEPSSSEGFIKGMTTGNKNTMTYLPSFDDEGEKALVLAVYNRNNDFVAGKVIRVIIDLEPDVTLETIDNATNITEKVTITPKLNFIPDYVNYEITSISSNKTKVIEERDPFGVYTWYPQNSENGNYFIKVVAIANNTTYESRNAAVRINISPKISLSGVKENQIINGPVNLIAKRNFDVNETIFYIKDLDSNEVDELKRIPYGAYTWYPDESMSGSKALRVVVEDTRGNIHSSDWITVEIDHSPMIEMVGVGPKQIVTKDLELDYRSNVALDNVKYILENLDNSSVNEYPVSEMSEIFNLSINDLKTGNYSIRVVGSYNGETISSEKVAFKIYKDKLFSAKPIIEKSKFLDFASEMALDSYYKTNMSAALQTAQGILETGWGQSVPVDKYSGKFSNNLFGIKGTGSNGSVTSNTWEVYNGVVYRVDDYFRAYNSVIESWKDHKDLLLEASRYSIFRDVMYDSSLGAWAIRRAGYATDPQYPLKLMRIIREYDLKELDKIDL
ncbi:MAG TPA: stalk domain-containing protein [Clostridia bacterium]|nr:stalk domain-containing protein [Clostridia bacterium]